MQKAFRLILLITLLTMSLTSVNAVAMPEIASNQSQPSAMTEDMDMSDCQHMQSDKKCAHCDDQHACQNMHNCATATPALTLQSEIFTPLTAPVQLSQLAIYRPSPPLIRPPIQH